MFTVFILTSSHSIQKDLYLAKLYVSVELVFVKRTFEIIASKREQSLCEENPEKLIDNKMKKVGFFPANLQNKKREKGVPLVVIYHPIFNSLRKIIQDNVYLLYMNEEVRETF